MCTHDLSDMHALSACAVGMHICVQSALGMHVRQILVSTLQLLLKHMYTREQKLF